MDFQIKLFGKIIKILDVPVDVPDDPIVIVVNLSFIHNQIINF